MEKIGRILLVTTIIVGFVGCGDAEVKKAEIAQVEQKSNMDELGKALEEGEKKIKANPNMSVKEQENVLIESLASSKGIQSQFEKIKNGMPKMVASLKIAKECLTKADSKDEAKVCMDKAKATIKKSGMSGNEEEDDDLDFTWDEAGKKELLRDTEEGIKEMEKSLPCIEKANSMMDLMQCKKY